MSKILDVNRTKALRLASNSLLRHSSLPHSRTLQHHREKPINWNTSHGFVHKTPILALLERCKSMFHLKQIQSQMTITGLILDGFASSRLIAFCAISEWRNLIYCSRVLRYLEYPNVFSWNVAIRGYSDSQNAIESILIYKRMLRNGGSRPDNFTYPFLLKVCGNLVLNRLGYLILAHIFQLGLNRIMVIHNASIYMLVSCGEVEAARKMFDESPVRDLVSWNTLINGYVRSGLAKEAIRLYREMESEGFKPDEVTMIGVVSSCAVLENLNLGREFHRFVEQGGLKLTVPLANALMDMFSKCGHVEEARRIFDKLEKRTIVSWTTMVVGYAKCGLLDIARNLFDDMPEKDVVPWNAIIGGYVQAKRSKEALGLFHEMQSTGITPDEVTMVHCLSACSQAGALDVGIWIHHYIERHNLNVNVALGTALVDMYAKCGSIAKALEVFHEMPVKNSMTWTAIIGGLALHGDASGAVSYFEKMVDIGLMPDEVTFLGVLSACCHGGLVEEGRQYFSQMNSRYGLSPQLKHFSCMVDLLGRAGLLGEAERLVMSMPMEADAVVWGALFFACRIHGDVVLGEKAASKLLELDPGDSGIYVLLCNMYGEANMWDEARRVRKMMRERGVEKTPGCSSIEVNGVVSEFIVRDKSHADAEHIYECLNRLGRHFEFVEMGLFITQDLETVRSKHKDLEHVSLAA